MIIFFLAACAPHVTPPPVALAEYVGDALHARGAAFGPGIAAWPAPAGDDPTRSEIVVVTGGDVRRLPFDRPAPELGGGAGVAWVGRRLHTDATDTLCLVTQGEPFCAESPFPAGQARLEVRLLDGAPAVWHEGRRAARPAGEAWALVHAPGEGAGVALDEAWRDAEASWVRLGGAWERVEEPAMPTGLSATWGSDGTFVAWVVRTALPHPAQRAAPISASRTTAGGESSVQTDVGVPLGILPISDDALLVRGSEAIELWRGPERVQRLPSSAGTTLGVDGGAAWVGVGTSRLHLTSAAVDAYHLQPGRFEWPGRLVDARIGACGSHPALFWDDAEGSWVATQGGEAVRIGRGCPDTARPWPKGSCEGAHVLQGSGWRACIQETPGATLVALTAE